MADDGLETYSAGLSTPSAQYALTSRPSSGKATDRGLLRHPAEAEALDVDGEQRRRPAAAASSAHSAALVLRPAISSPQSPRRRRTRCSRRGSPASRARRKDAKVRRDSAVGDGFFCGGGASAPPLAPSEPAWLLLPRRFGTSGARGRAYSMTRLVAARKAAARREQLALEELLDGGGARRLGAVVSGYRPCSRSRHFLRAASSLPLVLPLGACRRHARARRARAQSSSRRPLQLLVERRAPCAARARPAAPPAQTRAAPRGGARSARGRIGSPAASACTSSRTLPGAAPGLAVSSACFTKSGSHSRTSSTIDDVDASAAPPR